jgi:hypothetical protein
VIAGNIVGGSVLVALVYYVIYIRTPRAASMPAVEQRETPGSEVRASESGGNGPRLPAARE